MRIRDGKIRIRDKHPGSAALLGKFPPVIHIGSLGNYRPPDVVHSHLLILNGGSHHVRSVCSVSFLEHVPGLRVLYLTWNRVPFLCHSG
jgi:hypothetical protein